MEIVKIRKGYRAIAGTVARTGPTKTAAKEALLDALARLAANHRTHDFIFCGDGTILHVHYCDGNGWGYSMLSKDREYPSFAYVSDDYEETLREAIKHAKQSFGGVDRILSE